MRTFEQTDKVGFRGLLECTNSRCLESNTYPSIWFEILSDLTYQTLKR